MKYRLISLILIVALFISAAFLSLAVVEDNDRFIEHIDLPKKGACIHIDDVFCTHLPIVSLKTNGELPTIYSNTINDLTYKESTVVNGSMTVVDNTYSNNHLYDTPTIVTDMRLHYRGNSSMAFDKKSYKLKFLGDNLTENKDINFLSMGKHDEWILNGPYLDKTLLRNYMCMNISGQIMGSNTPDVRYCELFVNDTYKGLYLAMESVEQGEDRVNISKFSEDNPFTSYIVRVDRDYEQEARLNTFSKYAWKMSDSTVVETIYPAKRVLTPKIQKYIADDFNEFEKSLYSYDYDDKNLGYRTRIDVNSFVNYYIINEFFANYDAGLFSTYFYKDVRGKISIGPVWDFNNACDNYMDGEYGYTGFGMTSTPRFNMLLRDPYFTNLVIERYKALRKGVLSEKYLMDFIDDTKDYLSGSIGRNFSVWGYTFLPGKLPSNQQLIPETRNITSYERAIAQLKGFIIQRGEWMDDNIEILKQYSHVSKVRQYNY